MRNETWHDGSAENEFAAGTRAARSISSRTHRRDPWLFNLTLHAQQRLRTIAAFLSGKQCHVFGNLRCVPLTSKRHGQPRRPAFLSIRRPAGSMPASLSTSPQSRALDRFIVLRTFATHGREMATYAAVGDQRLTNSNIPARRSPTSSPCRSISAILENSFAYVATATTWRTRCYWQALAGRKVSIATPERYGLNPSSSPWPRPSRTNQGFAAHYTDPRKAVTGADAVYTDAWPAWGTTGGGRTRRHFAPYQVNAALMQLAKPVRYHALSPAHRGCEVTDQVTTR